MKRKVIKALFTPSFEQIVDMVLYLESENIPFETEVYCLKCSRLVEKMIGFEVSILHPCVCGSRMSRINLAVI